MEIQSENYQTSIAIEKVDKERDVCLVQNDIEDASLTFADGETLKNKENELIPILKTDISDSQHSKRVAFTQAVIEKDEIMETEEGNTKKTEIKTAMKNLNIMANSDSASATDSDADTYIIDVILEHRPKTAKEHSKAKKYKIKWEGYPDPSEHTWEPVEPIMETAELVVVEYWKKLDKIREADRLAKLKKKSDMKLSGATKRRNFARSEYLGPTDAQIDGLQEKVNHFEKVTELNDKLTAENNSNSIKLKKFIDQAKNGIPSKNQFGFMRAVYKVLRDNQRVLPLRDIISELKMYLYNESVKVCGENE